MTETSVPAALSPVAGHGAVVSETPIPDSEAPRKILIHVVEDGFSAHGQIWFRGQEIEYLTSDPAYVDTQDRFGDSWLDLDDSQQMLRYGRVLFRLGPWPGVQWVDPESREAELARGRKPRALGSVVAGRR